jgi:hypothetical protein
MQRLQKCTILDAPLQSAVLNGRIMARRCVQGHDELLVRWWPTGVYVRTDGEGVAYRDAHMARRICRLADEWVRADTDQAALLHREVPLLSLPLSSRHVLLGHISPASRVSRPLPP